MNDMGKLLEKASATVKTLRPGDVVEGIVLSKGKDEIVLDIGAKAEGLVVGRELEDEADTAAKLKPGDKVLATVVQSEDNRGFILLSLQKAEVERDWREAAKSYEEEKILEVEILGPNRGGVVARMGSLRGFIPFSHLALSHKMLANSGKLAGKVVKAKIIELNRDIDRLVLSEREALSKGEKALERTALGKIKIGEKYDGIVTSATPFAVFVQFRPAKNEEFMEGAVHVSELSWEKVADATKVVKAGDGLKVEVVGVSPEEGRVMLSHRRTLPNPWEKIAEKYPVGSKIKGKVTKIADFGAFVELEPGIEGLIHVTETTGPLAEGDEVESRVLEVDPKKQKIALSLKAVGAAWR
ncbi:MAG: RNA-binding S1 domain-containing protein, small subunit ribosomal protein S1 [candidate division WWE3 bacterium CSP1-7]|uniref:RNA-binding S1 domain-containing protein, small subunit ribosomal protein S1 n=2 Tax=Katanobacteria TaxID=422282 RepID=A0A0T5ZWY2_UNCKA|nr:MAG: RNA-binding S1 domain-containing protein, small subunit ribosomal protein S1 [candidate division WWE3 bacterium CSP1-7]